ncbi:hypothetical protein L210DRAFT_3561557, partial [Boletus edulis BED1]
MFSSSIFSGHFRPCIPDEQDGEENHVHYLLAIARAGFWMSDSRYRPYRARAAFGPNHV